MNTLKTNRNEDRAKDLLGRNYEIPEDAPGNFYFRLDWLGPLENITIDVILPHYDEQKFFVEVYISGMVNNSYIFDSWDECNKFLKDFESKMYYYADLANKVARNNKKNA